MKVFLYEHVWYLLILPEKNAHAFVYESNLEKKEISEWYGAINNNRSHAPIFVPEEEYRKPKVH